MIQITEKQRKEIACKFTKYEVARILGARALQIAMNAPILIKLSKEDMESVNYDPIKIAEAEFFEGILPISIKRPMPVRTAEVPRKKSFAEEQKEKELLKKHEAEKKQSKQPAAEPKEAPKSEDKILEEVEQTEIMELATPEDEIEDESSPAGEEKE